MKKFLSFFLSILLVIAVLISCTSTSVHYADTIAWDGIYDVIVVGFGGAGGVASITAADAGAEVLLLEKAPEGHHGGNTRVAGQFIMNFSSYEEGLKYLTSLRAEFTTTSDEELGWLVKGLMENNAWLKKMGAKKLFDVAYPEYPEAQGWESVRFTMVDVDTLFDNFNSRYWLLVERNVLERSERIDVWYSSPGKRLIQDPGSKAILGVQVARDGRLLNIRARNGVVLSCGGFENNRLMIQNYTQRHTVLPLGTLYNTGDGIKMVQEIGADLWHMSVTSGPFISYTHPGDPAHGLFDMMFQNVLNNSFAGEPGGRREGKTAVKSVFNVGPDGKRFTDEGEKSRHGYVNYNGVFRPQLAVMPMYTIFDEAARKAGRIHPSFSEGNLEEIKSGHIKKADTIRGLAELIGCDPNALEATFNEFNAIARSGKDPYFNRAALSMAPLGSGPYYALELVPGFVNTQGGAKRNTNCEVLAPDGRPIPHLYSAGEFGSFFPDQYNAGGNLGETMVSGRTAGANAARPKPELPPLDVKTVKSSYEYQLGSQRSEASKAASKIITGPGEFLGTGRGMGGEIQVKVRMEGSRIASVEIVSHHETAGISDNALKQIPAAIVAKQSPDVDIVSGATMSSNAIMSAVKEALSK